MEHKSIGSTLDRLAKSGALTRINSPSYKVGSIDIALTDIAPDPAQPRRVFDEAKLTGLAESIRAQGVLQPITVQPVNDDGKYIIIMGERRWRAAQLAGLEKIPSLVKDITAELRAIQLTENIQRADLTVMEIARAVEQMKADGKSRGEIAASLGWSESETSRFATVLRMPSPLQHLAEDNVPVRTLSDLHALWKLDRATVEDFISSVPAGNINRTTVSKLRARVEGFKPPHAADSREDFENVPPSHQHPPVDGGDGRRERVAAAKVTGRPPARVVISYEIRLRRGDEIGRLIMDRRPRSPDTVYVCFDGCAREEEVALSELMLDSVIDLVGPSDS